MATDKSRLPKELQTFKREMKKATFEEKVERYFSISPSIEDNSVEKKDIIIKVLGHRDFLMKKMLKNILELLVRLNIKKQV